MYELLHTKFSEKISMTPEEWEFCKSIFKPKKLRRRQYLLQEGDYCRYQAFIEKGIVRTYTVDDKGAEHILQFAAEGWWTADLSAFISGEPSLFNIEAIEDTDLLLLGKADWETLLEKYPRFERYFRIIIQNSLIATQKRLMQSLAETAEAKYIRFTKTYPDCIQRVPQHMIAGYLGVSRETLSRLRKNLTVPH